MPGPPFRKRSTYRSRNYRARPQRGAGNQGLGGTVPTSAAPGHPSSSLSLARGRLDGPGARPPVAEDAALPRLTPGQSQPTPRKPRPKSPPGPLPPPPRHTHTQSPARASVRVRGVRLDGERVGMDARGHVKRRRQRAGTRTSLRTPRQAAAGLGGRDQRRRDLESWIVEVGEYDRAGSLLKVTGLKGATVERGIRGRCPARGLRSWDAVPEPASGDTIAASWGCPAGCSVPPPQPQWNSPRPFRASAQAARPLRGVAPSSRLSRLQPTPRGGIHGPPPPRSPPPPSTEECS